jgi:hypothetical protein
VARPPHTNVVSHKWVFKVKYDSDGGIEKFKARLVARGFSQKYGVDYTNTFAPVIKQASVRLIFVLAAIFKCEIKHMDFPQAYLNAKTDHNVYMELPEGFGINTAEFVALLRKGLYGLKQSGMLWHEEADAALLALGFVRSQLDPCLYFAWDDDKITVCGLYVDDLLVFSQSTTMMEKMVKELTVKYDVKELGAVKRFLGMNVHHVEGGYFLEQTSLVEDLLAKHGLSDAKSQPTPLSQDHGFFDDAEPATMTATELREVVGSLLWLAGSTRPDITHAVNLAARFLSKANENHVRGIKRILRYLRGTSKTGLMIVPDHAGGGRSGATNSGIHAEVFADADWAGDKTNRRSTSGCLLAVNGCPVHWAAKQQAVVALYTMEAEYIAASAGVQECLWISQLLDELGVTGTKSGQNVSDVRNVRDVPAIQLWCDNQSAIKTMENDMSKARSKHIDIRYHFIREAVRNKQVKVAYCETGKMLADIFTKPLPVIVQQRLLPLVGVGNQPAV